MKRFRNIVTLTAYLTAAVILYVVGMVCVPFAYTLEVVHAAIRRIREAAEACVKK